MMMGALGLAVLATAFSADLSRVVVARARAQTAADAAALGTAQDLVIPSAPSATEVASDLAQRNGARLVECRCEPLSGEAVVTVEVDVSLPLLSQTRTASATARAVVTSPPGGEGMQPFFVARVSCLFERVGGLWIVSGFRTRAEQAVLFEEKPDLAAPPGHSNHELGLAADLGYPSQAAERSAHEQAASCGLEFPAPHEPWHVEPAGI